MAMRSDTRSKYFERVSERITRSLAWSLPVKRRLKMSLFGKKRIECPKGEWTTLISNFAAGMPADWTIKFTAPGGEAIEGSYIEKRYWWIFPQTPVTGKLTPKMRFHRYWINAIYSVRVCPDVDVVAEIS